MRAAAPLADDVPVEKIPDEQAVVALRLEQVGGQPAQGLGRPDEIGPGGEFPLLEGILALDRVRPVALIEALGALDLLDAEGLRLEGRRRGQPFDDEAVLEELVDDVRRRERG